MSLARRSWAIFAATITLVMLFSHEWVRSPDGHLHLRFLSVGQGDSTLLTMPDGKTVLIDGGPDWSTLEELGKFLPFFRRRIDLLVLSHPNLDHLLSFPEILKRYDVSGIALAGTDNALPRYREIFALAEAHRVPVLRVGAGQEIEVGKGVTLHVLWPPKTMPKGFSKNDNNQSVVLMLVYENHRALFTGDEEHQVEETLVRSHADLRADILKVAHHGSRSSSIESFLRAVRPKIAVISVGKNTYGHPRPEIVKRLEDAGAEIWRTDEKGTLEVIW